MSDALIKDSGHEDRPASEAIHSVTGSLTLLLGAILALAVLLRLFHLSRKTFWLDEWYSIATARLNWSAFVHLMANREANMVLYYALLRLWMRLGGSEGFIMILSVLFGLAVLPVVWAMGDRLFCGRVGLIAAFLLAINAFHIKYSQEVRGYSLLVLLAALSMFCFVRGIEHPSRKTWMLYGLATTLAIYTHLFGFFLLPSQWVSLLFLPRQRVPWRSLITSSAAVVFLASPLLLFAATQGPGPISWVQKPTAESVSVLFYSLAGGGGLPFLTLAYFVSCVGACVCFWKVWRSAGRSVAAWRIAVILASLLVPTALALALSFGTPMLVPRFLIICQPALVLLAAIGLSEIRPRWLLEAALAIVALLALQAVIHYDRYPTRSEPGRGDWSAAAHYVRLKAEPRDALIYYPWNCRLPFDYLGRNSPASAADPAIIYPTDWVNTQLTRAAPNRSQLQELATRYDRVWLVSCLGRVRTETPVAPLATAYASVLDQNFPGVSVSLYAGPTRASLKPEATTLIPR
jgi:uncharacterized membrane protein